MAKTVVFIEDEPDLCDIYQLLFSDENTKVHSFTSCKAGLEFIGKNGADIVFIDYRMPDINGIECRELIPDSIVCYMITGELDFATPPGFVEVIKKPLSEERFRQIMSSH